VIALDASAGMLDSVASTAPEAIRLLADGHELPLRDRGVDVVIAAWVLYHLPDKPRALSEMARVLRSDGRLVVATNSVDAFGSLDDIVHESVEAVLGRRVARWIEPLDFTLENGAEILGRTFARVEQIDSRVDFSITDAEAVVAVASSVIDPIEAEVGEALDADAFVAAVRSRTEARLADGPIELTRRAAYFVARDAST
jgi:SAM-dependent methyltransferase